MTTTWSATHYVDAASTNATPPYTNWATAARVIQDAVDAATSGDEVVVTNGTYATGGRMTVYYSYSRVAVDKPLTVRSLNGPQFTVIDGGRSVRCAYLTNAASLSGFTLTNGYAYNNFGGGVYCESSDAVISNCIIVNNSAIWLGGGAYQGTLISCTLTGNTSYWGGGATWSTLNNCVLDGNLATNGGGACGGTLLGCTLSSNVACVHGGGAFIAVLNNCVLTGNSAQGGGGAGGGNLYSCVLTGNSALTGGGALAYTAYNPASEEDEFVSCSLNNCTLTGNFAGSGGGAHEAMLTNCIVYFNNATDGNNYAGDSFNYCCTTPMPTNGVGNITNAPLFVDYAGGDLRLQSNSPCINAGNNAFVTSATDLDSNARIVSGTVDIGTYEFQGPGSTISYAWLEQFGLPTDGAADATDPDGDGHNVWQEWRCGTCPTNAPSALRLLSATPTGTNVLVTWASVPGVSYLLERATNLSAPFTPLAANLPGQTGTTSYADTNAPESNSRFYRVGVRTP